MAVTVPLCHIDDIEPGKARGFALTESGRDSLFVVRKDETVYGYWNLCPHQGSSLPWRKDEYLSADGRRIVCAAHGAEFNIETGACVRGAALGQSLIPADVSVSSDGIILADVKKLPGASESIENPG